jgi:hypothetical protein
MSRLPVWTGREHSVRFALIVNARRCAQLSCALSAPAAPSGTLRFLLSYLSRGARRRMVLAPSGRSRKSIGQGLRCGEKTVAWAVKPLTASGLALLALPHTLGTRCLLSHNRYAIGVTVAPCRTSPQLWRRRHSDTGRMRGPTVTRPIALQDYQ